MSTPLYRPEAQRKSSVPKGTGLEIQLEADRHHLVLTVLALVIVAIVIGSLFIWEHKRRIRVVGRLMSSEPAVRIVSQVSGQVLDGALVEGRVVKAGEALLTLGSERSSGGKSIDQTALTLLQQQIEMAESQIETSEAMLNAQQLQHRNSANGIRAMLSQLDEQTSLELAREKLVATNVENTRRLAAEGFLSNMQLSQKEEELLAQRARVAQLRRERANAELNLANTRTELRVTTEQAAMERARLSTNVASLRREAGEIQLKVDARILSPVDGVVTAVKVSRGQTVKVGETVLTVLPTHSALRGKALVPSAAMGFLRTGQQVFLHYLAFPYQKFGHQRGAVATFSVATVSAETGPQEENKNKDSFYEVLIDLEAQSLAAYGREVTLLPDMQFEADIVTESRTIFEWIFEPLFAAARR